MQLTRIVKKADGAVVGSHAVVTRDIASNSLAAGIPACTIREGITSDRRRL